MMLSEISGLSRKPPLLAKNEPVDDFLLGGGSTLPVRMVSVILKLIPLILIKILMT